MCVRAGAQQLIERALTKTVFPGMPAGNYQMTVEAADFGASQTVLTLTVGQSASLPVVLSIATAKEQIEVRETAQGIDTRTTEMSQVIDSQKIADLPIAGRDFIDFVLLTPTANVGRSTAVGAQSPFQETVLELSFAGLRETHSTFFGVDGTDYTTSISGVQRVSPSQDWVLEFRVVDSPIPVVNTVTKSGSNEVHVWCPRMSRCEHSCLGGQESLQHLGKLAFAQ
jgi:hypothetical protein